MSKQTPVSKPNYSLLPTDVEGFDSLAELALDMRWSWNHADDEVWPHAQGKLCCLTRPHFKANPTSLRPSQATCRHHPT
jgi:starch phosphorylase